MAEIVINFADKTPIELLGEGIKAYDSKNYHKAVAYFSKASELSALESSGSPNVSLGDIYLYYGKALLEVSRLESDPLGDAVPRVADEDDDDDEEDDNEESNEADTAENGQEQSTPEDAKTNGETGEEKGDENEMKVEEDKTEDSKTETSEDGNDEAKPGPSGDQPDEEKLDEPEKDNEEPTDLQLAWEVLELARVCFEKGGEKYKDDLAECYITLGEVSLESENFELAIRDIKKGLEVQLATLDDTSRTLAETYYKLGMAYATNSQHDDAIESYTRSLEILKKRLETTSNESEAAELKELLPEIEEKITDMKNLKDEILKKTAQQGSSSQFQNSPEKKATDISHLVKRKRKLEDAEDVQPAKKST